MAEKNEQTDDQFMGELQPGEFNTVGFDKYLSQLELDTREQAEGEYRKGALETILAIRIAFNHFSQEQIRELEDMEQLKQED